MKFPPSLNVATVVSRGVCAGALLAATLFAGCNVLPEAQPDTTRHYVLEARVDRTGELPIDASRIGLRPVEVPAYLRQKTIVVRSGENELSYARDARWAEPLEAGITRVLREHLAAEAQVVSYPFPVQMARDYDLTVRVLNAEGRRGGVQFVAVFELVRVGDEPEVVVRKEFRAAGSDWNGDYGRLAAELSAAVAGLAQEILSAVPARTK